MAGAFPGPQHSTEGAAESAVCDQHGKHHQHAAAGNKIPKELLEEHFNARVMLEVGTSLLITERVGCPGKWSGQDSSSIFMLYNQTFLSLPRNPPVSLPSCMVKKNTLEQTQGCNDYSHAGAALLTQKQRAALWCAQASLAVQPGQLRCGAGRWAPPSDDGGAGREALLRLPPCSLALQMEVRAGFPLRSALCT